MFANTCVHLTLYGKNKPKTMITKVVIRIRLDIEVKKRIKELRIKQQQFIEQAVIEKLERDFNFRTKIPF